MKRILMFAAIALPLLLACVSVLPAQAQTVFAKPDGALTATLPDYHVTIGVWAVVTPIGGFLGVFELQPNGTWIYSGSGGFEYADATFGPDVVAMGAMQWLLSNGIPRANLTLASRFPPIGAPTTDPIAQVNTALGAGFQIIHSPSTGNETVVGK